MSHAKRLWLTVLVASVSVVAVRAGETPLTTIRVASGLVQPLYVTHAPGDYDRIFIVEQTGAIRILKRGVLLAEPFLDVSELVACCSERGLLGLAFHPEYAQNGSFFIDYTDAHGGDTVVARYSVSDDPDVADPAGETILFVDQPYAHHNGGWIDFGPDGYLYIALGDGGRNEDPDNRGQSIEGDLLGNLLRIDVDGGDAFPDDDDRNYTVPETNPFIGRAGEDEIWAYGLRNPWRNAFDTLTGDLYIADVGERSWEEINFQAADSNGGENYGWRCVEGSECTTFGACDCDALGAVLPVHKYSHSGHCSITGGEVYRGCAIPDLAGTYFFADYCSNTIWSATLTEEALGVRDRTVELAPDNPLNIRGISSFGRDAAGEIYICDLNDGEVFKIVPDPQVHQTATNPPDGAIDARRHLAANGINRVGWDAVDMTFDAVPRCLAPADFSVSVEGNANPPPIVTDVTLVGDDEIRIVLDRVIDVVAWTSIFHHESAATLRIGVLPGDVDASRISGPLDILALINHLLNSGDALEKWSSDVDRSGSSDENDVVELLAVLGGGSGADPFLGASLP